MIFFISFDGNCEKFIEWLLLLLVVFCLLICVVFKKGFKLWIVILVVLLFLWCEVVFVIDFNVLLIDKVGKLLIFLVERLFIIVVDLCLIEIWFCIVWCVLIILMILIVLLVFLVICVFWVCSVNVLVFVSFVKMVVFIYFVVGWRVNCWEIDSFFFGVCSCLFFNDILIFLLCFVWYKG